MVEIMDILSAIQITTEWQTILLKYYFLPFEYPASPFFRSFLFSPLCMFCSSCESFIGGHKNVLHLGLSVEHISWFRRRLNRERRNTNWLQMLNWDCAFAQFFIPDSRTMFVLLVITNTGGLYHTLFCTLRQSFMSVKSFSKVGCRAWTVWHRVQTI